MRVSIRDLIVPAILFAAVAMTGPAMAAPVLGDIATIEAQTTGTAVQTNGTAPGTPGPDGYTGGPNGYPVITAILSQPGTFDGRTYSSWTFYANDGTGSVDVFASSASVAANGYSPAVGDEIYLNGKYSPFDQIPEVASLTSGTAGTGISQISSGNPVPSPQIKTIPAANVNPMPLNLGGYLLTLDNVTMSNLAVSATSGLATSFGTANLTGTITDSGSNSMVLFYWPSSYSSGLQDLYGRSIVNTPVDITGFADVFTSGSNSTAEFTPISIVNASDGSPLPLAAVPEPGTIALLGAGLAVCGVALRRRKAGKLIGRLK